jgi:hypothetical protein
MSCDFEVMGAQSRLRVLRNAAGLGFRSEVLVLFFAKDLDYTGCFLLQLPLKFDPFLNEREEASP